MREYSTPASVDIPPAAGLTDAVFERAAGDPGRVVMRRRSGAGNSGWQDVTARQFADDVTTLAKGLIATGIAAGDRVALMSRTRYEWTVIDYAIWAAGATTVPIYETSSAEQVEWILTDSGARALIVETAAHLQTAAETLAAAPDVGRVWMIEDGAAADGAGLAVPDRPVPVEPLSALAAAGGDVTGEQVDQRRTSRHTADLATIIYTSGTTGRPKGCELSHGNLLADVRNVMHGWLPAIFETPGASTLLFLPLAHSFARIIQVGCVESGVVLGHTPNVASLLPDLASFRPTFILAVPRVFEKVYNGAEQQAAGSPVKSRIFHAAAQTAIAWSEASGTGTAAPGGAGGAAAAAAVRAVRPAGLRQAAGRGGRPGPLRRVRRRPAGRAARSLLPRGRDHRAGRVRADREQRCGDGEPAGAYQDRYRWAATAGSHRADRRRRRDHPGPARPSSADTGTTTRRPPRCWPMAGCAPGTWARSTTTGTCG